jgi:PAS domain S-box-containing protein
MNNADVSIDELLQELQKLRQENEFLKAKHESVFSSRKLIEDNQENQSQEITILSESDTLKLLHDLQLHQIELEKKNTELMNAKSYFKNQAIKYSKLFDFAPTGYLTLSKDGEIFELNHFASQMLGKDREYLLNNRFGIFVTNDTKQIFNHFLEKIFNSKTKELCEVTLSTGSNSTIYVNLTGIAIENGEQCYVAVTNNTENKLAVEALRNIESKLYECRLEIERHKLSESENKYNLLINAIDQGYCIIQMIFDENEVPVDYRFIEINRAFEKQTGFIGAKDKLMSELAPQHEHYWLEIFGKIALTGQSIHFEIIAGSINRHYDVFAFRFGKPENLLVAFLFNDITERRQKEEEIKKILQTCIDGYYLVDLDGNILDTNDSYCSMIGYSRDELLNMSIKEVELIDTEEVIITRIQQILKNGWDKFDTKHICKNGRIINIEVSATFLIQKEPKIFAFMRDITERKQVEEKLRESELKYRSLIESSTEVIFCVNQKGEYQFTNQIFASTFDKTTDYFVGKTFWDIYSKDQADYRQFIINKVFETGESSSFEIEVPFKDKTLYFLSKANPIKNEKGEVVLALVNSSDITERKMIEEALRESESFTKSIIENEPECIKIINSEGILNYMNPAGLRMIEVDSLDQLKGRSVYSIIVPEQRNAFKELTEKVFQGESGKLIFEIIGNKGTHRWLETHAVPMFDKKNNIKSLLGITRDFTERKQVEESLKMSEERFRLIYENSSEAILYTNPNGEIYFANQEACRIFGKTQDEICNSGRNVLFDTSDHRFEIALMEREKTGTFKGELTFLRNDGTKFPGEISSTIFFDTNGNRRTSMIIRDITNRKLGQAAIHQKNKELEELNASKDKFFSIIAHDLKSPFNGFLGLTKMMSENINDFSITELQEISTNLSSSAGNLYQLLENLLQWSRMQRNLIEYIPKNFNLSSIIIKNINVAKESAKLKEINFFTDIPEDLIVTVDEQMCNTVLRNLISNAVKFTPRGGKIEIGATVKPSESFTVIYVKDNGIGIDRETISKLFKFDEKVSQKGTEGEPSTGLGLLLCKEFIEKHNGRIWVTSEIGIGSTFYFNLPK